MPNLTNPNITSWSTLNPESSHGIWILDFEGVLDVAEREERSGDFICGLAVDLWRTYKMVSTMYYETKKMGLLSMERRRSGNTTTHCYRHTPVGFLFDTISCQPKGPDHRQVMGRPREAIDRIRR